MMKIYRATFAAFCLASSTIEAGQTTPSVHGAQVVIDGKLKEAEAVPAIASNAVDLNQHGLTGSWYEPGSQGQGFLVEIYPDMQATGVGLAQVSWFTYDAVAGGAERQRWYTLSGPVVSGQASATLTIYENSGGNFNAPPVTTARAVGTATIGFDTCNSGQLSYAFTDGSGRAGSMVLTRLTQNVTCSAGTSRPTNPDFALSGNWGSLATSGQGFTIEVNPTSRAVFAAWYTYAPNGASAGAAGQRWYTAQPAAAFVPGMRSISMTIYETTGGRFDTPTTVGQRTLPVGSATLTFQSCANATFSYAFTAGSSSGASAAIALSRIGPTPNGCAIQTPPTPTPPQPACAQIGGTWSAYDEVTLSCSGSFGSGSETESATGRIVITQNGCQISFPSPLNTSSTVRTGVVTGNTFQASGVLAAPQSGLSFSQNRIDFSGTVSADGRRIDLTGAGAVRGTFGGVPGACTASSMETLTR